MKFRTPYDDVESHDHYGKVFNLPSLALQDEKEESDINYIVNKYCDGQRGIATLDLGNSDIYQYLQFGDATLPGDYETALDLVSGVREEFYTLPSKLRAEFNHDPMEFVQRLNRPETLNLLQEYGLYTPSVVQGSTLEKQNNNEINNLGENDEKNKI